MARILLIVGGAINSLFFLFHIYLGFQLHRVTQLTSGQRGLLEAFNISGALFILYFVVASWFMQSDLLGTVVGKTTLVLAAVLYLSRAGEEFVLFQGNLAIFASCLLTGLIYGALFIMAMRQRASAPVHHAAAA